MRDYCSGVDSDGDLPAWGDFDLRSVGGGGFISYHPVGTGLQLLVTGLGRRFEVDANRGYLNGAATSYSYGETDGTGWAGLVRAAYEFPFIRTTTIVPFAEYAVWHTKFNGYEEAGGAFPVTYEDMSDTTRRVRLGSEIRAAVNSHIDAWAWAAWSHRLDNDPVSLAGQVQGLFGFGLHGPDVPSTSGDAGIGATWQLTPDMEILTSVGASFANDVDPDVVARLGAKITLGSIY